MRDADNESSVVLRPRDTRKAALDAGGYSRLVGVLRWALPVAGLLFLAGLILFPALRSFTLKEAASIAPNLAVENLKLSGVDASNQPYTLTADKVLYAAKLKNLVDLEKPEGEIALEGGAWLAGKALAGRYDMEGKKLWLGGDVQFFHDEGYQFLTDEAQIDMKRDTAWGEKPVHIQGSFGTIEGEGFRVLEGGKVIVIEGHAKATLNLRPTSASDKKGLKETKKE